MKILCLNTYASNYIINKDYYNNQDIGLSKALVDKGIDVDIVYLTKDKEYSYEYYYNNKAILRIHFWKGFKFMSNAIYFNIFNRSKINKYDYIITFEYNRIMTYLASRIYPKKVILYHGPYKTYHRFLEFFYDIFFLKKVIKNIKVVFAKSTLSKIFLENKGITNVKVLKVGLDNKLFSEEKIGLIEELKAKINGRKTILWIGRFVDEKNPFFVLDILYELKRKISKVCLLIIGNGNDEYIKLFFDKSLKLDINNDIIYFKNIKQEDISCYYRVADIFILPSNYEVFGMVLLESMYFGLPVVTSFNGGSIELIKNGYNGYIVNNFNVDEWVNIITNILTNDTIKKEIGKAAQRTILENFLWDKIVDNIINEIKK